MLASCRGTQRMTQEKCYMCENTATSIEHVPPKCLFPEIKDSGKNHRVNLITVPSCHEHNEQKSNNDEFLMVSIAGIIGNNSIGYQHYHGKIQRSLKRTSFKLLEKVFLKKKLFRFEAENNFLDILWGTPDYQRLVACFAHIAHGIHRHHFKENFIGRLKPYLGFLHTNEKNPKEFKRFITHKAEDELAEQQKHGCNPDVFYYQFTRPDEFGMFLAKLCFYQNVVVYISYQPSGSKLPYNLGIELMNSGIKTFVTVGDKTYEFN